jgi:predicted DNA-binding protein (MmcQ/YjbR family)
MPTARAKKKTAPAKKKTAPAKKKTAPAKKKTAPAKKKTADDVRATMAALRTFALALPGANEHFPWGERVVKVSGKVFVFLGHDAGTDAGFSAKLPRSGAMALQLPICEPTGYGLGKSGWVSVHVRAGDVPPLPMLRSWIEESYRAVAPKKMIAQLDARR